MNSLELKYLKENNFRKMPDGRLSAIIMENGNFALPENGFHDSRQIAIVNAQFGRDLDKMQDMSIEVKQVSDDEYDVCLKWISRDDVNPHIGKSKSLKPLSNEHVSQISGEDLYCLVSQAIVLAYEDII